MSCDRHSLMLLLVTLLSQPLKSVLGTMVLVFEDDQPYDELDLLVEHNELATKTAGEPDAAAAAAADKSVSKRSKFKKLRLLT